MKPQRFSVGQAVTPRTSTPFTAVVGVAKFCPKFGEIYHVRDYPTQYLGIWCIRLIEGPDNEAFTEVDFDPVITTAELERELEEIENAVTA